MWRYGKYWQVRNTDRVGEPDLSTEYCGVELIGGWCKRRRGHDGGHANS